MIYYSGAQLAALFVYLLAGGAGYRPSLAQSSEQAPFAYEIVGSIVSLLM
jgi:hypothetical protein